jgi:hypothetical protein
MKLDKPKGNAGKGPERKKKAPRPRGLSMELNPPLSSKGALY